ncbi:MAG: hypothetical protein ACEPOZ_08570 [Marinifilaceae bacterium]
MSVVCFRNFIRVLPLLLFIVSCGKDETEIPEVNLTVDTTGLKLIDGKVRAIPPNVIQFKVENGSCRVEDEKGKEVKVSNGTIETENLGDGYIVFITKDEEGNYGGRERYETDLNNGPVYNGTSGIQLQKPITQHKLDSLRDYIIDEENDDYEITFDVDEEEILITDVYGASTNYPVEVLDEKMVFIRSLNGKIYREVSNELYQMIVCDLKEEGNELALRSFGKVYVFNENGDVVLNPDVRIREELFDEDDDNVFMYQPYYQTHKWGKKYALGEKTITPDKRLEAIKFHTTMYMPDFWMKVMFTGDVWSKEGHTNEIIGTIGESKRIESIQINVPKSVATHVYYRTYVRKVGWKQFHRNMEKCGNYHGETQGFQMYLFNVK